MGTRADFYIKKDKQLKAEDWLGSIAWDGYPDGIPSDLKKATTPRQFVNALARFVKERNDFTSPKDGWPWPWDDSGTTDYAYVFSVKSKKVTWKEMKYPDMTAIKNVQYGNKSGLLIFSHK